MSEINKGQKASGSEQRQHRHAAHASQGAVPSQSAAEARTYASRNNASAQRASAAPSQRHTSGQHLSASQSQRRSSQQRNSSSSPSLRYSGSSHTVRSAPSRRELTPTQRKRIEEARRRRQLQRIVAVIAAVLVLAVVTTGIVLGVRHKDSKVAEVADLPTATQQGVSETVAPAQVESISDASDEPVPESSDSLEKPVTYTPQNGAFVFDDAYVAAALGEVTGPDLVPDMSGIDAAKVSRWPVAKEGNLPVLKSANTTERVIAVTVDDCFQASNLHDIVQCALDNGARLTIFPIGANVAKENIASEVRWAWQQGMEIENHTYKHTGDCHYDDDYLTSDIWTQSYMLNSALGVNYKQHFFRPRGGDEREDQRVHAYVHQLGMRAIALWNVTGSTVSIDVSKQRLEPGAIYLFHTTNLDRQKLLEFIPYAVDQGYKLVTMNELFGLPDNETSELSTAPQEKPALESFRIVPMQLKKTTYARAAAVVQNRLIELGWLDGEADSVFGQSSYIATGYFQQAANIKADGIAGPATQAVLFSEDAPRKN